MTDLLASVPKPGTLKSQFNTPALCLDLDKFEANIQTMIQACRSHHVAWRPHAKCHKSPLIARQLVEAGAHGITCATLREAEIMAQGGITDLLIANLIAGPQKIERLVALTDYCRPIVCVDHREQAEAISVAMSAAGRSVRVLIELEIGFNRVGVCPESAAMELAQHVNSLVDLELAGVMAYEGHLLTVKDAAEKEGVIRHALQQATELRERLVAAGLPCPIVSCGGTGSFPIAISQPGVTEVQAGGAIFMDMFYREACHIDQLQHALTLVATIVSRPTPERAVMDAGRKALDIAIHSPRIVSHQGVELDWLSAEHGILKLDPDVASLEIGETIELIPGYADLTNNLHQHFFGCRGERLEAAIEIVH